MLDFSTPNPATEGKPFGAWWEHIHAHLVQEGLRRCARAQGCQLSIEMLAGAKSTRSSVMLRRLSP
jgi:hypothetical protein